jgi:hypothetical protein
MMDIYDDKEAGKVAYLNFKGMQWALTISK